MVERIAIANNVTYDVAYKKFVKEIEESFKTMSKTIRQNKPNVVICDKTNLYSHVRDREFTFFKENGYHITYVFFEPPVSPEEVEEWKYRLNNRPGKSIPDFVQVEGCRPVS